MMDRVEAEKAVAQLLIDGVSRDKYPSQTQMDLIEARLPTPDETSEYLEMLMDKIRGERYPSITMLRRLQRMARTLPEPAPDDDEQQ
jgi:hypothetical protein